MKRDRSDYAIYVRQHTHKRIMQLRATEGCSSDELIHTLLCEAYGEPEGIVRVTNNEPRSENTDLQEPPL